MATQEYHTPPERDVIRIERLDHDPAPPPTPRDALLGALFTGYVISAIFMALAVAFAG